MRTFTCDQGEHAFGPSVSLNIRRRPNEVYWQCRFGESCRYDLQGVDQLDYNKLAGLSFNLFTNHQCSAMLGWRYNLDRDLVELTPYYHVDGVRIIGPGNSARPILSVPIGVEFTYWLIIDYQAGEVYTVVSYVMESYHRQDFGRIRPFLGLVREIGAWFGGNQAAPHRMQLEKGA